MKKILSFLMGVLLAVSALAAGGAAPAYAEDKPLHIVATIFPQYDWVREILGAHHKDAALTLLLDSGVDLHNYQPTVEDIAAIAGCDLFIYVGGGSDGWVDGALNVAANPDRVVVNLIDVLGEGVKQEQWVEGMEHGHSHDDDDHDDDHEGDDHDHEDDDHDHSHNHDDEHIWLSLRNARQLSAHLADVLGALDPDNAADYASNAERYIEQLDALDARYQEAIAGASHDVLLFGDRFPFRYLTDDYNLTYYAAFTGCSAETEASFETVAFLSEKLAELELHSVMVLESSDQSIARTIIQNTPSKDQAIHVLDSMQSVTAADVSAGYTYLAAMEANLDALLDALR